MSKIQIIKIVGLIASVVGGLAGLARDWSHEKQDEEKIRNTCNEIFDERFANIQEAKYEEIEEETEQTA